MMADPPADLPAGQGEADLERRAADAALARDAAIDRKLRARHGVVHTPAALCRYVLHRADVALRGVGLSGLADPNLTIVDPAVGTGAFLASAIALGARGRLLGIDRDAEAIGVCTEALGPVPELRVADTLGSLPELEGPVLVVGNPPWVGAWAKHGGEREFSDELLEDFRRDQKGRPLKERKIGVLSDAYVRFFRWAAEVVQRAPAGALALVTNGSFLDGPVHRGMRGFLCSRFDAIEITDLGGSSLVARDGERDENVFGVRPSVAVTVASRAGASEFASLHYLRLRGSAEDKIQALAEGIGEAPTGVSDGAPSTGLVSGAAGALAAPTSGAGLRHGPLALEPPMFFFVPSGVGFPDGWLSLPELFPFHREGVQTNRDEVLVGADRRTLLGRMQAFALALARPDLDKIEAPKSHYDPEVAREAVREALERDPQGHHWIHPLAYRPFDVRMFVTLRQLCHRPRPALARSVARGGWSLLTVRKDRGERAWNHVAATGHLVDNCFFSSRSSCRTRAFPAWTPDGQANLSDEGAAIFGDRERAAAVALALLSAAPYRERFGDTLRRGYPRIPRLEPAAIAQLAPLGQSLAAAFEPSQAEKDAALRELSIGHRRVAGPAELDALRRQCSAVVAELLAKSLL